MGLSDLKAKMIKFAQLLNSLSAKQFSSCDFAAMLCELCSPLIHNG